jgi:hypothetical protein
MSLQGSLDTIGLADVLNLLATTAKSGELEVSGEGRSGQLWLSAGQLTGFAVGGSPTLVEAMFQLMRVSAGRFAFTEGRQPAKPQSATAVAPMLQEAKARLSEWRQIEALVPSLDARVELADDIAAGMSVSPAQWRLLVAIGDGKSVKAVLERRGLGEFDGCKAIKELIDSKLVRIVVASGVAAARKESPSGVVVGPAIQVPAPAKLTGSPAQPANGSSPPAGSVASRADEAKQSPALQASKPPVPGEPAGGAPAAQSPAAPGNGNGQAQKAAPGTDGARQPKEPGTAVAASAGASSPVASSPAPSAASPAAAPGAPSPAASPPAASGGQGPAKVSGPPADSAHASSDTSDGSASDSAADVGERAEGEEPLNRGMLLKFLSSVRS